MQHLHFLLVVLQIFSALTCAVHVDFLKTHYLSPRSHLADSCRQEHKMILRIVLHSVFQLSNWAADVKEHRPSSHTDLNEHQLEIFSRRRELSFRHWFGPDSEGDASYRIVWRYVELTAETENQWFRNTPDRPALSEGRVLLVCDYNEPGPGRLCPTRDAKTRRLGDTNTLIICQPFFTFRMHPDPEGEPRTETQIGILTRSMLKMPAIRDRLLADTVFRDDRTPWRNDDQSGWEKNANRYMWFLQDLHILWSSLRNRRA